VLCVSEYSFTDCVDAVKVAEAIAYCAGGVQYLSCCKAEPRSAAAASAAADRHRGLLRGVGSVQLA
jgi:hypothetical protein